MEEQEFNNVYAIPANFTDSGKLFGGMCAPAKALDLESYFAWLEAAEATRAQYRAGKITKEEALRRFDRGSGIP